MICRCGHDESLHAWGRTDKRGDKMRLSCTASDPQTFRFCPCNEFRESNLTEEIPMSKKVKKEKGQGRTPTLAPYVDGPFRIYMAVDGKEREAQVLKSGVIVYKDKEYTSPSSAANAVVKDAGVKGLCDGWKTWKYNKDGQRVPLNVLRGTKSPLKAEDKPKREKKAKAAKANGSTKPKAPRKPRKAKPNGAATAKPDVSDADIPRSEASATA